MISLAELVMALQRSSFLQLLVSLLFISSFAFPAPERRNPTKMTATKTPFTPSISSVESAPTASSFRESSSVDGNGDASTPVSPIKNASFATPHGSPRMSSRRASSKSHGLKPKWLLIPAGGLPLVGTTISVSDPSLRKTSDVKLTVELARNATSSYVDEKQPPENSSAKVSISQPNSLVALLKVAAVNRSTVDEKFIKSRPKSVDHTDGASKRPSVDGLEEEQVEKVDEESRSRVEDLKEKERKKKYKADMSKMKNLLATSAMTTLVFAGYIGACFLWKVIRTPAHVAHMAALQMNILQQQMQQQQQQHFVEGNRHFDKNCRRG